MKSFLKVVVGLFALAVAFFPNEVASLVSGVDSLSFLHDSLISGPVVIGSFISLANIDATSYQTPNPGGVRSLFIALRKDIKGIWPKIADIDAGEIKNAPVMVEGRKFAEYQFPDGTCSLDDDASGDPGFQSYKHTLELMMAGFSKELAAEILKHLNAGAVVIVEMNDGQYVVGGSSDNPIYIKPGFKSGKKGADKRGYTLKGEQDGFMWGILPLKPTVVTELALLPDTEEEAPAGGGA
ncbi:hypothetical protein LX87_05192 [Larkinella arboricola]|uniref:Uncharacterized protein n=1 Tax=Larkinella arboricola TaxID=643671 RepID=A0A327WM70_LARAB|nr:hypothetical protein [Larkinella arboricola]RAJ92224.1 hypothetical protein LX87_05192 [Larkinella arboricola]